MHGFALCLDCFRLGVDAAQTVPLACLRPIPIRCDIHRARHLRRGCQSARHGQIGIFFIPAANFVIDQRSVHAVIQETRGLK